MQSNPGKSDETQRGAGKSLCASFSNTRTHQYAVNRRSSKIENADILADCSFRNGVLLAAGTILIVEGVVRASHLAHVHQTEGSLSLSTQYLLQIYAGYFLLDVLLLLHCVSCRAWHASNIDYASVFQYDPRYHLNWRQDAELPCWCYFLLGLVLKMNFHQLGGDALYPHYPVLLIGLSVVLLLMPFRFFYYKSRLWLLYSLWRAMLAGAYSVEWRDIYVGDMFCSLTYSMGNLALFSCLYARGWDGPEQCDSSHSRALGFMTTLPSIWRALQCIRRYRDTGYKRTHLLNCGKYISTISFYAALSVYRIDESATNRRIFIILATLNGIFTSFWDLYYDWRLGDPHAKPRFLRRERRFRMTWVYYAAIIINPILRFTWIFYIAIPRQLQHSAITSFGISLGEVLRRGLWSLFRVENEHCTRIGRLRARRILPYHSRLGPELESRVNSCESQRGVGGRKSEEWFDGKLTHKSRRSTASIYAEPSRTNTSTTLAIPGSIACASVCRLQDDMRIRIHFSASRAQGDQAG